MAEIKFADISEDEFISKINSVVQDEELSVKFAQFSKEIRSLSEKSGKSNSLKSYKEKKEYLNDIRKLDVYKSTQLEIENFRKLVDMHYVEFFLPYAMGKGNVDNYKNVELTGLGLYEHNEEVLFDESIP